ncbi:hypothetical protein ACFQH8_04365 [Halomicroarcula sp. GCM10025710]
MGHPRKPPSSCGPRCRQRDGRCSRTGTAARRVAALEEGTRAVEVNHDVERATEIRLHHVDLPRLAAADLVHYDPDLGIVENDELPLEGRSGSRCRSWKRSGRGTATDR